MTFRLADSLPQSKLRELEALKRDRLQSHGLRRTAAILAELGYQNVRLVVGDGSAGWADEAPYDRIIVTAASSQMPEALFGQLRDGGILVIPIGDRDSQTLQAIHKLGGQPRATTLSGCQFVPLVGEFEPE